MVLYACPYNTYSPILFAFLALILSNNAEIFCEFFYHEIGNKILNVRQNVCKHNDYEILDVKMGVPG